MQTLFIDVREPFEYDAGHVPGAINIPLGMFGKGISAVLKDVSKDAHIVLYCRSGNRSGQALLYMQQIGFTNVENGINADYIQKSYL